MEMRKTSEPSALPSNKYSSKILRGTFSLFPIPPLLLMKPIGLTSNSYSDRWLWSRPFGGGWGWRGSWPLWLWSQGYGSFLLHVPYRLHFGEAIPIKFIKVHVGMESLRRGKLCRHGEWFTLIKFTNEVYCNGIFDGQSRFVGGQVFSLQSWKDSDSVKEQLLLGLLWVRIPRLLLEV